jgi:prepilin-type N-terminal cleavage/methylation domain-containing protein
MKTNVRQHGFSLMELVIAVALGLILMGMVAYSLSNTSRAVNTVTSTMNMNSKAMTVMQTINREFEAMYPMSQPVASSATTTEFRILRILTNTKRNPTDPTDDLDFEMTWVRYKYDATNDEILRIEIPEEDDVPNNQDMDPATLPTAADFSNTPAFETFAENITSFSVTFDIVNNPYVMQLTFEIEDPNTGKKRTYTCTSYRGVN